MILTYIKLVTYFLEYHFMRLIAKLSGWPLAPLPNLSKKEKETLNKAVDSLLTRWKKVIKLYPKSNKLSNPLAHLKRYHLILKDLKIFLERKNKKDSHDLREIEFNKNCPEYFKRNYHYQTGGYFTEDAAARYDHQIELLFLGVGHIMRKVGYSVLSDVMKPDSEVLEFGAASGTSGHQFRQLFPKSKLDILEPGENYLKYAKKNYSKDFNQIIPGFMEKFVASKKYDVIFSCFVMHEIPVEFWNDVTKSIKDSLKEGGHLLIIDAQQDIDKPEHQFALDQFAEDFYEPYFAEYRKLALEDYFQQNGFKLIEKSEVLFSKALLFSSPT
jgi:SAM-dependent methyltransferase